MAGRTEHRAGGEGVGGEGSRRPQFTTTTSAYAHDIYRSAVEEKEIHEFLRKTDAYDTSRGRWCIPEFPTSTEDVMSAVSRIFSTIVQRFAQPRTPGVERNVVAKGDIQQVERESEYEARKLPSLIVQAAGPSFQTPSAANSTFGSTASLGTIGYTNIASCSTVKLESDIGTEKENVDEMEVHARQIFRVQPNRSYVRSLILTERHARLVHFDRAGSQMTPLIDIHQHPETLVRLIAGLSSINERLLGLDDSVQWAVANGKKTQGRITMTGPSGEATTYPIVGQLPVPRHSICSRGTTCWTVKDPETSEEYVVKDSWREDDLATEHELLERVKDIPGVVHMVSCEPDRGETKDFRCMSTLGRYKNRKASRVLLKLYGKSVEYFSSALQVLYAFRDAILAHEQLLKRGILHRDISLNNILLGKPGAPEGERGILIDLDLAFLATDAKPKIKADYTIGTQLFQSIPVLQSCELRDDAWEHDYLDDLEAFLYSFAFILLCYRPDGSALPNEDEGPRIPWSWAEDVPAAAQTVKWRFFGVGTVVFDSSRIVETIWGPACGALLNQFRRWIFQTRGKKGSLIAKAGGDTDPLRSFHSSRGEHYSTVTNMFDVAIAGILSSTASPPQTPAADVLPRCVPRPTPIPSTRTRRGLVGDKAKRRPTGTFPSIGRAHLPPLEESMDVVVEHSTTLDGRASTVDPSAPYPAPVPTGAPPLLRRSTRIRALRHTAQRPSLHVAHGPQPTDLNSPAPPAPTQLRRSTRIQKRQREEDQAPSPNPKARRIKKDYRPTPRPR